MRGAVRLRGFVVLNALRDRPHVVDVVVVAVRNPSSPVKRMKKRNKVEKKGPKRKK